LANPTTEAYTSFATQAAMVAAILKERRIEFLAEGRRWSDIHRLQGDALAPVVGVPAKVANATPPAAAFVLDGNPYSGALGVAAIPYSDRRFVWPIPQIERNTNPNIDQNTGW
jgi:hypothetical protein